MSKILIISSRQLCYNSGAYFAECLGEEFTKLGIDVEIARLLDSDMDVKLTQKNIDEGTDPELSKEAVEMLERFMDKEYMAIIDFNSRLPRIQMDDGSYYLDHIDAPFFDFILDNPLYHHQALSSKVKRFNVFTIDNNHAEYIRKYYPNVNNVYQMTLGAKEAPKIMSWKDREKVILFTGTYNTVSQYEKILNSDNTPMGQYVLEIIKKLLADENLTIEKAVGMQIEATGNKVEDIPKVAFATLVHRVFAAEKYMHIYSREKIIDTLVSCGLPVKAVGNKWELYSKAKTSNFQYSDAVDFDKVYEETAKCAMLLDCSPFFKNGIHDRLPAAFGNRTMVFTERNSFKEERFNSFINMYTFKDLDNPEKTREMSERIKELLYDEKTYNSTTEQAYEVFKKEYSWEATAKKVLKVIVNR